MLVLNFFAKAYETINGWFKKLVNFDEVVKNFYNTTIAPLPEIVKIIGAAFLTFLLLLGIFSFIKKFIKTSIIIAIILIIVVVLVILL